MAIQVVGVIERTASSLINRVGVILRQPLEAHGKINAPPFSSETVEERDTVSLLSREREKDKVEESWEQAEEFVLEQDMISLLLLAYTSAGAGPQLSPLQNMEARLVLCTAMFLLRCVCRFLNPKEVEGITF